MYPIRSTKMAKGRPCSATRYAKTDIVSADYRAWLRLSPAAPTPPASASPLAPSSIVSVPLALAPVVVCFQVRVLPDELNAKPRRSISSPRWKPEIVPETCPPEVNLEHATAGEDDAAPGAARRHLKRASADHCGDGTSTAADKFISAARDDSAAGTTASQDGLLAAEERGRGRATGRDSFRRPVGHRGAARPVTAWVPPETFAPRSVPPLLIVSEPPL